MKPNQRANYAARIERALQHLQHSTGRGVVPPLSELAAAAALSEYHFHRIFRIMTGETVGEATTRIRLGQAVHHLEGDDGIRNATSASGYATTQSLTRALKQQSGVTPGKLQDQPVLRSEIRDLLARAQPGNHAMVPPLSIEIVSFAPLRLLAVRNVGDYRELNHGFGLVFERVCAQLDPESIVGLYGIPHDDPRDVAPQICRFDCALDTGGLGEAGADLQELRLDSGRYARLPHFGDYDGIHAAIDALYAWAIEGNRPIDERPLFIQYLDDPEQVPVEQLRAFAYLPLAED